LSEIRATLLGRLRAARRQTDLLFALIEPEGLYERPIAERHRLVFYLGHVDAFDWNLVCRDALGAPSIRAEWERLFAFGIDPVDGHLPSDVAADWPAVAEVRAWNEALREAVDAAVARAPLTGWLEGGWALHLAVEHRLMHAETLCYLLSRLPYRFKRVGPGPAAAIAGGAASPGVTAAAPGPPAQDMVAVPAGRATLGLSRARAPYLGWDNEYEVHEVEVPAFRVARHMVTNAEFLRFVEAGGYRERALWSDADWRWRQAAGVIHPALWAAGPGGWTWRAMSGELPLPPAWPVWVSHAEASAYARWARCSLPTEAQWHRAAFGTPGGAERAYPWGSAPPEPGRHGAFGLAAFDPVPVGAFPAGRSAFGVDDLLGAGWQWTRTPFVPFAGFVPLPFYRGYSADFFDGRHLVLKGASPRTDVTFLRRSFRNWFQPHYPHVYAGFRLAEEGR